MTGEIAAVRLREEAANAISHGLGLLGAVAVTPWLVLQAGRAGGAADLVGSSVFGASLILLYLASTAFHAVRPGALKATLQRFDHAAIYVLIAGTYTPFTLGVLGGAWGWTLFGVVWGAAGLGVATKLVRGVGGRGFSTAVYVAMGWLVLVAIHPLVTRVPAAGVLWLLAGGSFYSFGVIFYARRAAYSHAVWHVFVLLGSACHVVAVLRYATG